MRHAANDDPSARSGTNRRAPNEHGVEAGLIRDQSRSADADRRNTARKSAATAPGNVVTIAADNVTLRGLRITGSGLRLSDDDAAIFVTGNHATIENNVIADSLHGIYLKKVSGAQILNNRIQGKTTLSASTEPVEKGIGQSAENCDTTLVSNRRGNGIHQWNCEGNLIRGNEISETRDGIYFSFTNNSRVENNLVHHVRYGLHYMYSDGQRFREQHLHRKRGRRRDHVFERPGRARQPFHQQPRPSRLRPDFSIVRSAAAWSKTRSRENAVGLSFNQCNANRDYRQSGHAKLHRTAFRLELGRQSFHRKYFRAQSASGRDRRLGCFRQPLGRQWRREFLGRRARDRSRSRRDQRSAASRARSLWRFAARFSRDRISLRQSGGETAALCERARGFPGMSSIEDPAPLTSHFWKIRAQSRIAEAYISGNEQMICGREPNEELSGARQSCAGFRWSRAKGNHVVGRPERRR